MADKDKLADEKLSDEQLDQVAGGYDSEIQDDANRLRELGYLGSEGVTKFQLRTAFSKLGLGIAFYFNNDTPNEYWAPVRGELKKVDRKYFWDYIYKQMKKF